MVVFITISNMLMLHVVPVLTQLLQKKKFSIVLSVPVTALFIINETWQLYCFVTNNVKTLLNECFLIFLILKSYNEMNVWDSSVKGCNSDFRGE